MAINIHEVRARSKAQRLEEEARFLAGPTAKELAQLWIARQQRYRAAGFGCFRGRFATRAELIDFLEKELSAGTRPRSAIAADAGMATQTLADYITKGKVRASSPAHEIVNECSTPEKDRKRVCRVGL